MLDTVPDLLREGDKKYLMHQLLRGIAYMHDRWFLHRDLKVHVKHRRLAVCVRVRVCFLLDAEGERKRSAGFTFTLRIIVLTLPPP